MIKRILTLIVAMVLAMPTGSWAASTQVDSLIKKLVEKGILDKDEARELKMEIAEDTKALQDDALQTGLPEWVKNTKLKGDVRLRYQGEYRKSTNKRDRARVRYRLGLENKINDKVEVGAGLASGGADPRSTNQTLEDGFQTPDIRLDYAYAKYTPFTDLTITGGKAYKTFWNAKDLLFDSDLTFDGVSTNYKHAITKQLDGFVNTGFYILDENSTENYDPYMYVGQTGVDIKPSENVALKLAGTYYGFDHIKDYAVMATRTASNSTYTGGGQTRYSYDYDSYSLGGELSINKPFVTEAIPYFGLFAETVKNLRADEHDSGFIVGAAIGDKKVAGPNQWQLSHNYRRLERNAFMDNFPDSDFYGGAAHVQGHETVLSYGLGKNVTLDLDYYRSAPIGGEKEEGRQAKVEHLYQADLNIKF